MTPVLGPLLDDLARLHERSDDAGPSGSAYISGWYGYVDKDLRTLLGRQVGAPYSRRYCGAGVLATCREALWAALDAAAAELEAKQGPDSAADETAVDSGPGEPETEPTPERKRRAGRRASVPSWDEIMLGKRKDG